MAVKIDVKDRKILYQLDVNSRQSFSQIGKKVHLAKTVVSYRIINLKEKGVIKNYFTVIDASRLGYTSFRFYLVFQRTTSEIEKEILNYFVENKYTWWVCSVKGRFDLAVAIWVKDINDFYVFWEKTLQKYRHYFQDQVFSVYFKLYSYRYSYLLLDEYKKTDRKKFEIAGGGQKVDVDKLDFRVLQLLAPNARISTKEVAEKLNTTATTIKNRINKLLKLGVIQGFRVNIDYLKLGYQLYKADIKLTDYTRSRDIIRQVVSNPHLVYLGKSAGYADLELDFLVENVNQFFEIMELLTKKFPDVIKNYKYFYESKIHKMQYLAEEVK